MAVGLNLWQRCVSANGNTKCENIPINFNTDFGQEGTAERDVAIFGVGLGALFSIGLLVSALCKNKCSMVAHAILAFVSSGAAIGCWLRLLYVSNEGSLSGPISPGIGFYVECGGVFMAFLAIFLSCAAPKSPRADGYSSLNLA
eukprot:UC1_evm1s631